MQTPSHEGLLLGKRVYAFTDPASVMSKDQYVPTVSVRRGLVSSWGRSRSYIHHGVLAVNQHLHHQQLDPLLWPHQINKLARIPNVHLLICFMSNSPTISLLKH